MWEFWGWVFWSFFISMLVIPIPGPFMFYTISEVLRRGFRAGMITIVGHITAESLIVLLLFLFSSFLALSSEFSWVVGLVGGVVMVFLGVDTLRLSWRRIQVETKEVGYGPLLGGIAFTLFSPIVLIWWTTVASSIISQMSRVLWISVAAFLLGHWPADKLWWVLLSLSVDKGKLLIGGRGYRIFLALCGTLLVLFGLWLLASVI